MSFSVVVTPRNGGRPLEAPSFGAGSLFAPDYGELLQVTCSTAYEEREAGWHGGFDLASWTVEPAGGQMIGMFQTKSPVVFMQGGSTLFKGLFSRSQPNDNGTVTFHAKGHCHELYRYDSYFSSTSPNVLFPTNQLVGGNLTTSFYGYELAEAGGLPIAYIDSPLGSRLPTGAWGASNVSQAAARLGTVLTKRLWELGYRFEVWGPVLVVRAPQTAPLWRYTPPRSVVGISDDDYASHLRLQFVNNSTGLDDTVEVGDAPTVAKFGRSERSVDYRGAGPMTETQAIALAGQVLETVKGRYVVAGGFTVTPSSGFTSMAGGAVRNIGFVRAGQPLVLDGVRSSQGEPLPQEPVLIARTEYVADIDRDKVTESLTVTLPGTVDRDIATLLAGKPRDTGELMSGTAA